MKYSITVSGAELEVIMRAIGRMPTARPVKERTPSAPQPVVSTGDGELDAWMRQQYDRGVNPYVAKALPKAPPLKPKKWTSREIDTLIDFNQAAVQAWVRLGYDVVIEKIPGGGIAGDGSNVTVKAKP